MNVLRAMQADSYRKIPVNFQKTQECLMSSISQSSLLIKVWSSIFVVQHLIISIFIRVNTSGAESCMFTFEKLIGQGLDDLIFLLCNFGWNMQNSNLTIFSKLSKFLICFKFNLLNFYCRQCSKPHNKPLLLSILYSHSFIIVQSKLLLIN